MILQKLGQLIGKDVKVQGDQVALSTADVTRLLGQAEHGQVDELAEAATGTRQPPKLGDDRLQDEATSSPQPSSQMEKAEATLDDEYNMEMLKNLLYDKKMAGNNIEALNSIYHERHMKAK